MVRIGDAEQMPLVLRPVDKAMVVDVPFLVFVLADVGIVDLDGLAGLDKRLLRFGLSGWLGRQGARDESANARRQDKPTWRVGFAWLFLWGET